MLKLERRQVWRLAILWVASLLCGELRRLAPDWPWPPGAVFLVLMVLVIRPIVSRKARICAAVMLVSWLGLFVLGHVGDRFGLMDHGGLAIVIWSLFAVLVTACFVALAILAGQGSQTQAAKPDGVGTLE